ncbi:MAG: aspartate carbamoyltransferase catalytic subunit, partial [Clostridiales bacterium]|nr:aspartate carbamoyltransferase catalytic subunit [Clostridiales bacterium]
MKRKDILGIKDLSKAELNELLAEAEKMRGYIDRRERLPLLSGKTVATLFYENSTRTRNSFDMAAKNLGASTMGISVATSSVQKGESLIDTGKTLTALGVDVIVIRHSAAGAPRLLAENVSASVINAGDGQSEHPSQALLDVFTAKRHFDNLAGLKVVIVGDIKPSRVARSDTLAFTKLGAFVTLCAPYTLLPEAVEEMGATVESDFDKAITDADVIMPLRIQLERMHGAYFSSIEEYHEYYGVTERRLERAAADSIVMHPAPINRGAEIDGDVADGYKSVIEEQVTN